MKKIGRQKGHKQREREKWAERGNCHHKPSFPD